MPRLRYNLAEIPDFVELEPGKYKARLATVVKGDSRAGNPMLTWTWILLGGPNKGSKPKSYTSLQEQALGNLKQHLLAFGLKGKIDASTDELIGEKAIIVLAKQAGETREGAPGMFTRVVAVLPIRRKDEDDDDEEEEPKPKKKRTDDDEAEDEEERPRKRKPAADDEDDEDEPRPKKKRPVATDEDEDEDEAPKKKKRVVEEEEEEETPRKKLKKVSTRNDDEDDEEETPKKKKKRVADDDDDDENPF